MKLQYGLDPEYFASIRLDKDYVISPALLEKDSGLKFLYQDEDLKHPIYIDESDYSWMMDGCAFELTVKKPLNSAVEIFEILNKSTLHLTEFLNSFKWNQIKLDFYNKPVINIEPEWYLPFLNDYKIYQGFIFGCDPDEDAILPNYKCKTIDVETHLFRYGGGHFHLSGVDEFKNHPLPAVKLMAITGGNYFIANSPYPELEKQRALTYGQPGRYRQQIYSSGNTGIEYRTPSNSWTSFSLEKMEEFVEWFNISVKFLVEKNSKIIDKFLSPTIKAIVKSDINLANNILYDIRSKYV